VSVFLPCDRHEASYGPEVCDACLRLMLEAARKVIAETKEEDKSVALHDLERIVKDANAD
jgi:hypothetical protein